MWKGQATRPMKGTVVLYEHPGCNASHYNLGAVRRCKNSDNKWVQDYAQGTYYLLTREEWEVIKEMRNSDHQ